MNNQEKPEELDSLEDVMNDQSLDARPDKMDEIINEYSPYNDLESKETLEEVLAYLKKTFGDRVSIETEDHNDPDDTESIFLDASISKMAVLGGKIGDKYNLTQMGMIALKMAEKEGSDAVTIDKITNELLGINGSEKEPE